MELNSEQIRNLPAFNRNLLNVWADCCSILLSMRNHVSPVQFNIKCDQKFKPCGSLESKNSSEEFNINLRWKNIINQRGYEDLAQVAEFAGYGMGILIITEGTEFKPFSRTAKGNGVDIILTKDNILTSANFLSEPNVSAYLEAKGTMNLNSQKPLFKKGLTQSENTSKTIPVYVISTEFESPSALISFRNGE